jgi:putative transposase
MYLVDTYIIKANHKDYKELDHLCFLSKNLYNSTLYEVRQCYFKFGRFVSYYTINKLFIANSQVDYRALPARVSVQVQKLVDQDFKSYLALLRKKKNGTYSKPVKLPRYADKIDGRKQLHYDKWALSFKRKGYAKLSQTNIYIKLGRSREEVRYIDIVPRKGYIKILVGYQRECEPVMINNRYASIDLGVNNLALVSSNVFKPYIINGKPLKSINQYSNKLIAKYTSLLATNNNKYSSKRLDRIRLKRENKINDYLHKASTYIVSHLVSNDVRTLIIGYNKEWKQDTNMGKSNNQNFVCIPFYKFKNMIEYKCKLLGIKVVEINESHTSKCSFLDGEEICHHEVYKGYRVKRGLYKSKFKDKEINADLNGSLNILRKYLTQQGIWNILIELDIFFISDMYKTVEKVNIDYNKKNVA